MKLKKQNILAAILFCGFLGAMAVGFFVPKSEFSEMEKRFLAKPPRMTVKTVRDGSWGKQVDSYLIDHIPGRNFFVGIHSYLELAAGRQQLADIWLEDGKLLEAPVAADEKAIARNMKKINAFADGLGRDVHLMVVPSAGFTSPGFTSASARLMVSTLGLGPLTLFTRGVMDVYESTTSKPSASIFFRQVAAISGVPMKTTLKIIPPSRRSVPHRSGSAP